MSYAQAPYKNIVLSCSLYRSAPIICRLFDIHMVILLKCLHKKVIPRLTAHGDVITPLLRGAPRLGLALGPAPASALVVKCTSSLLQ